MTRRVCLAPPPSAKTLMILCVFSAFLALGLALTTQLDTQQQQKSELHTTRTGSVIFSGKITTVFSADLRLAERLTAAVLVEQVERTALNPPAVGSVAEVVFGRCVVPLSLRDKLLNSRVRVQAAASNSTSHRCTGIRELLGQAAAGDAAGLEPSEPLVLVELTRNVSKHPWLERDYPAGTRFRPFSGPTYGVISESGIAVQDLLDCEAPFYEMPANATRVVWSAASRNSWFGGAPCRTRSCSTQSKSFLSLTLRPRPRPRPRHQPASGPVPLRSSCFSSFSSFSSSSSRVRGRRSTGRPSPRMAQPKRQRRSSMGPARWRTVQPIYLWRTSACSAR